MSTSWSRLRSSVLLRSLKSVPKQMSNPVVLKQVTLPNGQFYQFKFNIYGEIVKIIYPTGGYERFAYDAVAPISYTKVPYKQANRGVVDRWVSAKGDGTDETHWQYSGSTLTRSVTAPNGTRTDRVLYTRWEGNI